MRLKDFFQECKKCYFQRNLPHVMLTQIKKNVGEYNAVDMESKLMQGEANLEKKSESTIMN